MSARDPTRSGNDRVRPARADRRKASADRILGRLLRRWAASDDDGRAYLEAVLRAGAIIGTKKFLQRVPLPIAQHGRKVLAEISAARAASREREREAMAAASRAEEQRRGEETARLEELRQQAAALTGSARLAFLAGLAPGDRDRVATRDERAAAIALRKTAMLAGRVRTELDRWNRDGRLPHLFVRVLPFERATACRFWDAGAVEIARRLVVSWRDRDARTVRGNRQRH